MLDRGLRLQPLRSEGFTCLQLSKRMDGRIYALRGTSGNESQMARVDIQVSHMSFKWDVVIQRGLFILAKSELFLK